MPSLRDERRGADRSRKHVRHQGVAGLLQESERQAERGGRRRHVRALQADSGLRVLLRAARTPLHDRRESPQRRGAGVYHRPLRLAPYLAGEEQSGLPQPLPYREREFHGRCLQLHRAYRPRVAGEIPRGADMLVGMPRRGVAAENHGGRHGRRRGDHRVVQERVRRRLLH